MAPDWALSQLRRLLPLDDSELQQVLAYTSTLPDPEAAQHLQNLLGESPESLEFIASFLSRRPGHQVNKPDNAPPSSSPKKQANDIADLTNTSQPPPPYMPSATTSIHSSTPYYHTNAVIKAGNLRARDEQHMQQILQDLRYRYHIYNTDIEPEHETDYWCSCPIHQYQQLKMNRRDVQEMWAKAVMYPGERHYNDLQNSFGVFGNPYTYRVVSPYGGPQQYPWTMQRPLPFYHARSIQETIALNAQLNSEAQAKIDAQEPRQSIWMENELAASMANVTLADSRLASHDSKAPTEKKRQGISDDRPQNGLPSSNSSKLTSTLSLSGLKKAVGLRSAEEKAIDKANSLRKEIMAEEQGRWPNEEWKRIVTAYQNKVGMANKIAELRSHKPIQYLHLLRAGYFEPIPVAWANQISNPLKFSIEAASGWRGITPAWRGFEDLAEERLYWVLNHREGSTGMRMKPDFISEMNMARARMARAVEPPPLYYSANDTCRLQHTSAGYSKQVMPAPFRPYDRPELPTDDTMILLDVSGSMGFDPVRPVYDQYLITGFVNSSQPRNGDVAKAIIRRFTDAMANHDHRYDGYDLVTFANEAKHIGRISHMNFDETWNNHVRFGGGTRVMTGWQKVKELHFQKHSQSAVHHPVYGWQAGPETPILRLLLLLDGEATDMDEFELDLLGLSWAHVTIFLIGVDGCPHHHRHANELQRISDFNHHVSFVDAQGNCPERFVTHELLKRHLGYDISMQEFEQMEDLPTYSEY